MKFRIILSSIILILAACSKLSAPVPSQIVRAKAISNHAVTIRSYEIPDGIFRGVLWPSKTEKNFQVWIIKSDKEIFFNIPAPPEFTDDNKEITEEWKIKMTDASNNKQITYIAEKNDGTKSLQIDLPFKKRKYTFSVLSNALGNEMLLFMDISENVVDKGLFGYVILEDKT